MVHVDHKEILREINVGLWIMRVNLEEDYIEMYADETTERLMAVEQKLTPQEYYSHWFNGVKEEYRGYILDCARGMMASGEIVNMEYSWLHPTQGEVTVRGCGKRVEDADGMVVLKGYHYTVEQGNLS